MIRPRCFTEGEWLVVKVGVVYALGLALFLFAWWKGWLKGLQ